MTKRKRAPDLSVVPDAKESLPEHNKPYRGKTGKRVIENPYFNSSDPLSKKWIEAPTSLTRPLESLYNAKKIKSHQYMAGCELERLFEAAEPPNARAFDPSKVGGGGSHGDSAADAKLRAYDRLKEVRAKLGEYPYALVRDVLTHGWTMKQATQARGFTSNDDIRSHGFMFRSALDSAAEVLGFHGTAPARRNPRDKFSTMGRKAA